MTLAGDSEHGPLVANGIAKCVGCKDDAAADESHEQSIFNRRNAALVLQKIDQELCHYPKLPLINQSGNKP